MTESPSFCVVTPSFNQGRFIERTIRSVLDQGIDDLDYVVVDGGSDDETVDVLRRYDAHVRWVSEADRGQTHAVNKGLAMTSAPLIGWLNSDDVYLPGALAAVTAYFDAHPEVDLVYGDARHIGEHDEDLEGYPTEAWDPRRLEEVCYLCQPATFFRRRMVERIGPLDEQLHFCMDYEYWLRAQGAGIRFGHLPQVLAGSRLYATNKTLGSRVPVHREMNAMLRRRLGQVPDRWISNHAHAVLEARGMRHAEGPLAFAVTVSALCWLGALRWNRRISPTLRATTWGWIRGNWTAARQQRRAARRGPR